MISVDCKVQLFWSLLDHGSAPRPPPRPRQRPKRTIFRNVAFSRNCRYAAALRTPHTSSPAVFLFSFPSAATFFHRLTFAGIPQFHSQGHLLLIAACNKPIFEKFAFRCIAPLLHSCLPSFQHLSCFFFVPFLIPRVTLFLLLF